MNEDVESSNERICVPSYRLTASRTTVFTTYILPNVTTIIDNPRGDTMNYAHVCSTDRYKFHSPKCKVVCSSALIPAHGYAVRASVGNVDQV